MSALATVRETREALNALGGSVCTRCGEPEARVVLETHPVGVCLKCVMKRLDEANAKLQVATKAHTP